MLGKRVTPSRQLGLGLDLSTKKTCNRELPDETDRFCGPRWCRSLSGTARGPRPAGWLSFRHRDDAAHSLPAAMARLSNLAIEEGLHDVPLYREFAGLGDGLSRLLDEPAILPFRHLLKALEVAIDMLRVVNAILQAKGLMSRMGTAVDAALIAAP